MLRAIRPLQPADWPAVRAIYEEGIATGHATFETEAPSWERWDAAHLQDCRLIGLSDEAALGWTAAGRAGGAALGWAALSPVSSRCVYAGVAEVSVYVSAQARGRGVGRALLAALVEASERSGLWTLQAGMLPRELG